jgi:hypothetical protein
MSHAETHWRRYSLAGLRCFSRRSCNGGRHRHPAGATLRNYTNTSFWRRDRSDHAEAS